MWVAFLLLWHDLQFGDRFCGHHRIAGKIPVDEPPLLPESKLLDRSEWQPIRVVLDTSSILLSENTCRSEGQFVNWSEFSGKCRKAAVLTDAKLESLRKTFDNMESYISRLLRVDPERSPIGKFNADLVITVSARAFSAGDKTLGFAAMTGRSAIMGRPNRGSLTVNSAYIPEIPQSEHSIERLFFTVMFHEIMHVLGMDGGGWTSWIDKRTGKKYDSGSWTKYTNSSYSKSFFIVHTPALHKYATERFGVSEFAPGVPSGMEVEDGGGLGTAMAHPESRVYMSEVMCGIFVGYVTISNLSMAILEDTGWYEVNYSMAEPYSYGDGKSMQMEPLKAFPVAAPQLAFPSHYLCWEKKPTPMCHHDFRSKAYCSPVTDWSCPGTTRDDSIACSMRNFVNPLGIAVRGDRSEFEYIYFKVGNVSARCEEPALNSLKENQWTGEEYGDDSMCVMSTLNRNAEESVRQARCHTMKCDPNGVIAVTIDNQTEYCRAENQILRFEGFKGHLVCPNPRLLCGMKQFLGKDMIEQEIDLPVIDTIEIESVTARPPLPSITPANQPSSSHDVPSTVEVVIVVFLCLLVVSLFLAVYAFMRIRRRMVPETSETIDMQENLVQETSNREEPRLNLQIPDDEPEVVDHML